MRRLLQQLAAVGTVLAHAVSTPSRTPLPSTTRRVCASLTAPRRWRSGANCLGRVVSWVPPPCPHQRARRRRLPRVGGNRQRHRGWRPQRWRVRGRAAVVCVARSRAVAPPPARQSRELRAHARAARAVPPQRVALLPFANRGVGVRQRLFRRLHLQRIGAHATRLHPQMRPVARAVRHRALGRGSAPDGAARAASRGDHRRTRTSPSSEGAARCGCFLRACSTDGCDVARPLRVERAFSRWRNRRRRSGAPHQYHRLCQPHAHAQRDARVVSAARRPIFAPRAVVARVLWRGVLRHVPQSLLRQQHLPR